MRSFNFIFNVVLFVLSVLFILFGLGAAFSSTGEYRTNGFILAGLCVVLAVIYGFLARQFARDLNDPDY